MAFTFLRRWFARPGACIPNDPGGNGGAEEQFQAGLESAGAQEFAQAAHWFTLAAEANHGMAQLQLATLFEKGQGVTRDGMKSLLWLKRSANLGTALAQYRLGVRQHLSCRGNKTAVASEDRIEALKWARLSAAQGCVGADGACEYMALDMTLEEVAESGRRVDSFVAGR